MEETPVVEEEIKEEVSTPRINIDERADRSQTVEEVPAVEEEAKEVGFLPPTIIKDPKLMDFSLRHANQQKKLLSQKRDPLQR